MLAGERLAAPSGTGKDILQRSGLFLGSHRPRRKRGLSYGFAAGDREFSHVREPPSCCREKLREDCRGPPGGKG